MVTDVVVVPAIRQQMYGASYLRMCDVIVFEVLVGGVARRR